MQPEIHFFIGKGGVGKSTTSALTSIFFASAGRDTLLVSMDPAHNQRDIFETDFSEKPRRVCNHLWVKEVDTDYWISRYLKDAREHIRKAYMYENAFNLQDHFKVLQFSPGLEEYALLLAFENVLHRSQDKDAIIFDMAPTALTLRFFSLPSVSLIWLGELLNLRNLICEKKEIISRIRMGGREIERDRVKEKLGILIDRHRQLRGRLLSDATRIHLVMNGDRLSFSEALRIQRRLAELSIQIWRVVVNKIGTDEPIEDICRAFAGRHISRLPMAQNGLEGFPHLQQYMQTHRNAFNDLLPRTHVEMK